MLINTSEMGGEIQLNGGFAECLALVFFSR